MSGCFITIEGGEGAGKSTLLKQLETSLLAKGLPVLATRAPGGTKLGSSLRDLLLHAKELSLSKRAELFLFLCDRAQHVDELIHPALSAGKIVLCDRFNDSTIAYQGGARGFAIDEIKELCRIASHSLQPDLTLYLDLDPAIGFARVQKSGRNLDRIEKEDLAFHSAIRISFLALAKEEPKRIQVLDATKPIQTLLQEALTLICSRI